MQRPDATETRPGNEPARRREEPARLGGDAGGAFGDLGTLLPYALGATAIAGLSPIAVFGGFALVLIASGAFYGIPMAVQPMKAVGAVILTGELTPAAIMASGLAIGATMLVLALSGFATRFARLVPQSVTAGLQLGLGLTMIAIGLKLMAGMPWLAAASIGFLLVMLRWPRVPAAALLVALGLAYGHLAGMSAAVTPGPAWSMPALPSLGEFRDAIAIAVLPQLALTLTNAVILTAALSRDLFPARAARAGERNLALTTGLANLLLAPFGAMPMCHGAGGLQAQWRFGARSGHAPIILGLLLLALLAALGPDIVKLIALMPGAALGALLAFAGADLATSRRLFDARPRCWPTIAVAAALTLFLDAAWGLAGGFLVEKTVDAVIRHRRMRGATGRRA